MQFIFVSDYRVLGSFFRLKIVSLLIFCSESQSGQLHSERAVAFQSGPDAKKQARSERLLSQSNCFILTDKK